MPYSGMFFRKFWNIVLIVVTDHGSVGTENLDCSENHVTNIIQTYKGVKFVILDT